MYAMQYKLNLTPALCFLSLQGGPGAEGEQGAIGEPGSKVSTMSVFFCNYSCHPCFLENICHVELQSLSPSSIGKNCDLAQ